MRISDWSSDVCSSDLDPPVDEAPTGVIEASCYRQVEGAGILNGTDDEEAAGELIDFLLSETVQADVAMSMFVYPVRRGVDLPAEFREHAVSPDAVHALPADAIHPNRARRLPGWADVGFRRRRRGEAGQPHGARAH